MAGDPESDGLDETVPADREGVRGSGAAADAALIAGRRYEPIDELARGGIGRIVRARDLAFDRIVAIKEPLEVSGADRLRAEATILASLQHPSIVPVFDQGTNADGVPFFAMKLVDGRSLREVIVDAKTLEQRLALIPHVVAIAEAMAYAHGQAVIHRDLKPANVLVGSFDETVVIDWGLAKVLGAEQDTVDGRGKGGARRATPQPSTITNTGDVMGTPAYMAPEQARGERVDARADVYALGAILYHVLAGAAPYAGHADSALPPVLLDAPPPIQTLQPRAPADLVAIVAKAMAREAADRYPTAAGFAEALLRYQARPAARRWWPIAAVVMAAGIGAMAVIALRPSTHAASPPPDAGVPGLPDLSAARLITSYGEDGCAYAPMFLDDQTLVYDATIGDAVDLYELPLGGAPIQLTSAPTWEWMGFPGRRPGEVVHLVHDVDDYRKSWIGALDLETHADTRLISIHARAVATLDGAVLYVTREGAKLYRWRDGREEVVRTPPQGSGYNAIAVSPRGDRIALMGPTPAGFSVCVLPADDLAAKCLVEFSLLPMRPAFSADGDALYYQNATGVRRRMLSSDEDTLIVADAFGEGGTTISPHGAALVYSQCGAHAELRDVSVQPSKILVADDRAVSFPTAGPGGLIAWTHSDDSSTVLMVRVPDGSIRQLTSPALGLVSYPAFSPDGRRVAFVITGSSPGIYVADVGQFGVPQQITSDVEDRTPSWITPQRLAFTRNDASQIQTAWYIDIAGGDPVRIGTASRYALDTDARTGRVLLSGAAGAFYWWDPKTERELPGPPVPKGTPVYAFISPNGAWLGYQLGPKAQDVWRVQLDPLGELEHVWTAGPSQTQNRATITDDGHVLAAPESWSGDLRLVPAAEGSRF